MKLKAFLLAVFVAGFSASLALADPGHGKGGDKGKGDDDRGAAVVTSGDSVKKSDGGKTGTCRPRIELELRGTVAAAPTTTALAVLVTKGGAQGASLAGKQLSFDLTGARVSSALKAGDAVQVKATACVDLVA